MTRSFEDYIARATSLLEAGFGTKQAQKDALDYVGRAYEMKRDEIQNTILKNRPTREDGNADTSHPEWKSWSELYYVAPHGLYQWRPKHSAALIGQFPAEIAAIETAVALRAKIAAAPIVKKPPVKTAKQREAEEKARTCQICGRPIFAETGVIAHHGYQRPGDGWQTASCQGARELPFETSKAVLEAYIISQNAALKNMKIERVLVATERKPFRVIYQKDRLENGKPVYHGGLRMTDEVSFLVSRMTFPGMEIAHPKYFKNNRRTFDDLLAGNLRMKDFEIDALADHITWQEGRAKAWKPLETWNAKSQKWEAA